MFALLAEPIWRFMDVVHDVLPHSSMDNSPEMEPTSKAEAANEEAKAANDEAEALKEEAQRQSVQPWTWRKEGSRFFMA